MEEGQKSAILSTHKMLRCRHPSQSGCDGCQKFRHCNPSWPLFENAGPKQLKTTTACMFGLAYLGEKI